MTFGLSRRQFAKQIGRSVGWVQALVDAGRLVLTPDGKIDGDASRKRLAETAGNERDDVAERWAAQREAAPVVEEASPAPGGDESIPSKATSAAKKEFYAAQQAELEYRRSIGAVVEKIEVAKAVADIVTTFRQSLEQMPHRTAPELIGKDLDAIRAVLKQDTHAFLAEMEREFAKRIEAMGVEEA